MGLAQFSVGLQEGEAWQRSSFALRRRIKVNQIRKGRASFFKGDIRERFVRTCEDAVIRNTGMLDNLHIALRHVAADAVVRWFGTLPGFRRQAATLVGVALHAL